MIDLRLGTRGQKRYKRLPELGINQSECENKNLNLKGNLLSRKSYIIHSKLFDARTISSNWFRPNMTRFQATTILSRSTVGSFIVRRSTSQDTSFVISVHGPGDLVEHHLLQVGKHSDLREGLSLLGSEKIFPSFFSLVTHLSIMRESLPCTLDLNDHDGKKSDVVDDDIIDIDSAPGFQDIIRRLQVQLV